ncbi:helix-turn-helix transcriptional regulator [Kribbella rubisoli]|uniref:helix-turn-helix transcriptional regulator n=1 Tax=Kribbella rubisoli TaxID=3075929 RepID=UPI001F545D42|nr:LuxR family transcriptional regulator [Kribbella rubisoli]
MDPSQILYGRRSECTALDQQIAALRSGRSAVLVLRGEAGIGKTALLDYVAAHAVGCRIVRAAGVESEMELAFGGLHQLCSPFLDRADELPEPQRDALRTAFGLSSGTPPDRFLVGLAVLSLLAAVAEEKPLLCLIDDAQWLDRASAQTIAFVARRLLAEQVGLFFGTRGTGADNDLAGLQELPIVGLNDRDSRALLDSVTPGRVDERVRDQIVAETHGNPLAILELPHGLTTGEMPAGFGTQDRRSLASQLEEGFLRRLESLPEMTQRLLLIAAAEPIGDVLLLWRAAEGSGIGLLAAASPAEAAGLITIGARVRFRHPLVRSAVYYRAPRTNRRKAHQALAEATDARTDPDRRAWHLAHAAVGPDEDVAAELERSADRAQARGGIAATAAFLERAAELTPDPDRRGARAFAAAQAKYQAGAFDTALELLDTAELSRLGELELAHSELLRGRISFASRSPSAALPLLLDAAKRLEPVDANAAHETYRDAMYAALTAGRVETGGVEDIAEAVLVTPPTPDPGRTDLLLNGVAAVVARGFSAGVPLLKQALVAFENESITPREGLGWLPLASRMAHDAWEFDSWTALSARLVDLAREAGALSVLPSALLLRLSNRVFAGDIVGADSLAAEAMTIGAATGSRFLAQYGALVIEPWRGREEATRHAIEAVAQARALRGEGKVLTATQWAAAVLYNGLGRFDEAYAAAEQGCAHPQELGLSTWSLIELIEAAVRTGRRASATDAIQRLIELTQPSGTAWALGTLACMRAVVTDGVAAEPSYQEAIDRLDKTEVRVMRARARLLYGEWLAGRDRRADARVQLSAAHEMFDRMGAEAFAHRAGLGLDAVGAHVQTRRVESALTPQEAQIAHLAATGMTNPEIGAELFLSPHTIDWHLRKVFTKLGIASRREIRAVLATGAASSA